MRRAEKKVARSVHYSPAAAALLLAVAIVALFSIPAEAVSTKIHAFYYPWYGNPTINGHWIHWEDESHDADIGDLASTYYPELGPYSTLSPDTIHQHMKWLIDAGIGVIVLSWWGRGTYEDTCAANILNIAALYGIKCCFHIEPYGGRTAQSAKSDIMYLIDRYGSSPAFYRDPDLGNRPVFYFFASGLIPDADWAAAWDSIRGTAYDSVVIGDTLDHNKVLAGHWNGFYNYAPGQDSSNWSWHRIWAQSRGLLFVPPIGPGYDDTQIRDPGWVIDRAGGQYCNSIWATAVASGAQRICITSWNEWHEGTQIEPAIPKTIATRTYPDYTPDVTTCYLDKTASWAAVYDPASSGKIQCEDYSGGTTAQEGVDYHDTTPGNSGGRYRSQNVDIQDCAEGGYNVGWIAAGEWLRYTNVQVTRDGPNEIRVRAAAWNNPAQLRVCDGSLSNTILTLTIPVTGAFQNWRTVSGRVSMSAGNHTIYLVADTSDFNLNWFEIRPVVDVQPPGLFWITLSPYPWANSSVTATFSAQDNPGGSGIEHYEGRIGQGPWRVIASPWVIQGSELTPGPNEIRVRAYDFAGNYRDSTKMAYYDPVPPAPFTPVASPPRWASANISITFSTADNLSGVERYEAWIDSTGYGTVSSPWKPNLVTVAPGSHTVTIRAVDRAGNYTEGTCRIHYAQEAATIAHAKALPDGQFRSLKGKIVTFPGDGFFYIEEPDRTSGIKVISAQPVAIGDVVELGGVIGGAGIERFIDCGPNEVFVNP